MQLCLGLEQIDRPSHQGTYRVWKRPPDPAADCRPRPESIERFANFLEGPFVEVEGVVLSPASIEEISVTSFAGTDFGAPGRHALLGVGAGILRCAAVLS